MKTEKRVYTRFYETHLHTSQGSACGSSTGGRIALGYADAGFAGLFVTDHFFNGNTTVPRDLPWAERIHRFCAGYEDVRAAVAERGVQVFLGWEFNYKTTEFLTLGLGRDFLLAHPGLEEWDAETYLTTVRKAGGFVIHAHPFRVRDYIREIRLYPDLVDAVEVYNPGNQPYENDQAALYAAQYNLPVTAGSDVHARTTEPCSGLAFAGDVKSEADIFAAIRSRQLRILRRDRENRVLLTDPRQLPDPDSTPKPFLPLSLFPAPARKPRGQAR